MSKPKKDRRLLPVSNILQSLFVQCKTPLSEQFLRWKLWNSWAEVVGPVLSQYSEPVAYRRGTLVLWVKSAAHMHDMTYVLENIREKVNEFLGQNWAKSIRLTLDRRSVPTVEESDPSIRDFISKAPGSTDVPDER